jgi:putative phage-type endonuclease
MIQLQGIGHSVIVADFSRMSHDDWEQARNNHYGLDTFTLGASDAGTIMNHNKYKDQAALYLEKLKEVEPSKAGEAAEWGHRLEPVVADKFQEMHPEFDVVPYRFLVQHPKYDFMVANLDRLIQDKETGEYGVLEVKTASEYVKSDWENGSIPKQYYDQVQHQLEVTGLQWAYIAFLVGGNKYDERYIERNEAYIQEILFQEEMFIFRLENKQMPDLTGSDSSSAVVVKLFPEATEEKEVKEIDESVGGLIIRRKELDEQIKTLTNEKSECENKIKAHMAEHKKGMYWFDGIQYTVSYGNSKGRKTFDSKGFKEKYQGLYEEFTVEGNSYRTLRITAKEEK